MNTVSQTVDIRIKNHDAIEQLRRGVANKDNIDVLISSFNMAEALAIKKIGADWMPEIIAAQTALFGIASRGGTAGRFVAYAHELTAVNLGMEIHDAQLDAATVKDIEDGLVIIARKQPTARRIPTKGTQYEKIQP